MQTSKPGNFYVQHKAMIDKILFFVLFGLSAYLFISYLFVIVAPFVIAFAFSLALDPFVSMLQTKWKINRGLGAFIGIFLIFALLGSIGAYIVVRIVEQAQGFVDALPHYLNEFSIAFAQFKESVANMLDFLPFDLDITFESLLNALMGVLLSIIGGGESSTSSFVANSGMFVIGTFFCFLSTFFFVKDKALIRQQTLRICPPAIIRYYNSLRRGLFTALGGYVKSQCIMTAVAWIVYTIGLFVIGYDYALLMGLLMGLLELLPVIGTSTIVFPWFFISAISGDLKQGVAVLIIFAINFVLRQLLEPKVMSSQMGLHPLLTLTSIYIGLHLFGAVGFFIGPIVAITMKIMSSSSPYIE